MIPRLNDALDFQGQALLLRAERQRVIAGNIANADTPGYQARDFDFAQALRAATNAAGASADASPGAGIASGVMGGVIGSVMDGGGRVAPTLRYAVPSQTNLDRNTVDMDRERSAFVDNAVKYESTLRFINGGMRTMLDAMKSHHQA